LVRWNDMRGLYNAPPAIPATDAAASKGVQSK
jgi:hypothetical protein